MLGIRYYKADPSTYVLATRNGQVVRKGRGQSFFYNQIQTSISAVPVSAQEAPFIFGLQTADFQEVRVQGQITFRISVPEKTANLLNFALKSGTSIYASDDPRKLSDRVVVSAQAIVQEKLQKMPLRSALATHSELAKEMRERMKGDTSLSAMGVTVLKVVVHSVLPTPETKEALEAEAREAILKEADDAIYLRRRAAVEQERTIQEAELQTKHEIQQKEQEIEESRIHNERSLLRGVAETERERIQSEIEREGQRQSLVELAAVNSRKEADAEAYAVSATMNAIAELPVENLKALSLAKMVPEQLMAMAFETFAENAEKIGELNITPDIFSQLSKKVTKS